jgi:iron complex outermembrane recepter protein
MHVVISYLLAATSLASIAHAAEASPPAPDAALGGDIVVTAQKREQKLKDVPLTVSALSQAMLDQLGVSELGEMAAYVPGLQIQKQSANNPGFVIRGITSDSGSAQAGSRVTVYYNGEDISRARGAWQDLFDMERIEVAKGPQATLFGTAAEVGAVSMISAKPQPGTFGEVQGSFGNYNRTQFSAFLNTGNDTLAWRFAVSHKYRHGYTRNDESGQDDLNGEDDWGARASVRWRPSTSVTLDAVFTYDGQRDPGTGFTSLIYPTQNGTRSPFGDTQLSGSPYAGSVFTSSKLGIHRDVYDGNITLKARLSPNLTFTTVNAYRTFSSQEVFDADGSRLWFLEFEEDARGKQYSHEGRFNFDTARFHATAGWNVFIENGFQRVPFSTDEGTYLACTQSSSLTAVHTLLNGYGAPTGANCSPNSQGQAIATAGPYAGATVDYLATGGKASVLPYSSVYKNTGINKEYSAYADGTYVVSSRLELTAGLRFLAENRISKFYADQPNSVLTGAPLLPLADTGGQDLRAARNFTAVLPRFNALYRLTPDVNLYATISEGRYSPVVQLGTSSGSPQLQIIPAEHLWNYEAGIKGRVGPFSGSLAAFYQVYSNFQVTVTTASGSVTQSAGTAHNPGVEAEGTWHILPSLSATGMVAWLHGRVDNDAANGQYAGNHFRLQPDYSASLALDWHRPLTPVMDIYIAPNWSYRSSVYFEMPNSASIFQGGYSLYNLRAGIDFGSRKEYSLGGFVQNLANRHYLLDAGNTGESFGDPTYIAAPPRMYGIEARARF